MGAERARDQERGQDGPQLVFVQGVSDVGGEDGERDCRYGADGEEDG